MHGRFLRLLDSCATVTASSSHAPVLSPRPIRARTHAHRPLLKGARRGSHTGVALSFALLCHGARSLAHATVASANTSAAKSFVGAIDERAARPTWPRREPLPVACEPVGGLGAALPFEPPPAAERPSSS